MNPIRVCSGCNTTKTPLWRSGPKGPKSLCNACGIRQRKARRAMANGKAVSVKIEGKHGHLKKHCKTGIDYATNSEAGSSSDQKQKNMIFFDDFLSKSVSLHCVFPDEEKDAAVLLMALSSGLQVYAA